MRQHAIVARQGRAKRARSVPPQRRPEIGDRVQRQFKSPAPDRLWCTDITMIGTRQGWLHAAVILDAYSRKVVSWSVNDRIGGLPRCPPNPGKIKAHQVAGHWSEWRLPRRPPSFGSPGPVLG